MNGLTVKPIADLLPLAKAWLTPAKIEVVGGAFRSDGFDPAQRAYVLTRAVNGKPTVLECRLLASPETPLVHTAILVKGWGEERAHLRIDGKLVMWGNDYRRGHLQA
jgi:hypothetical protein